MAIDIDVQFVAQSPQIPDKQSIKMWVRTVLAGYNKDTELVIRVVDEDEGIALNKKWRQSDSSTNVLSFPVSNIEEINHNILGDIVICAPVVVREAREQGKSNDAHWAHMVIHGVLHLLGHDHITKEDAEIMETLETDILADLGYANPYTNVEN
jgi:probable rRNA maturation factor